MIKERKKTSIELSPLMVEERSYYNRWCQRCNKYFCSECVAFQKIRFHIIEKVNNKDFDWIQNLVCPKCYNELVRKYYDPKKIA